MVHEKIIRSVLIWGWVQALIAKKIKNWFKKNFWGDGNVLKLDCSCITLFIKNKFLHGKLCISKAEKKYEVIAAPQHTCQRCHSKGEKGNQLSVKVGQEPRTEMNSKAKKNRQIIPAVSIVYSRLGAENKSEAKPHTCKTLLRR